MPTIADQIASLPSGARFYRADLHIHSLNGSHDVSDATMTVDSIVKTSLSENLALIAITDHNEIANVESAIKAANGSAVTVIPGVELSTPEGHLLVYFATVDDLASFYGKLTFADKGTANYRCQTSLLECLNKIDPTRGYAILAHVDAKGGLEKKVQGNPRHKRDIITHRSLIGIELRSVGSDISYADSDTDPDRRSLGQERIDALSLGNKQFLARVLFSDAHSVSALGKNAAGKRRVTRMKMDSPSFAGVRVALQDADARIRIEENIPQSFPYVMGMSLEGNFLDGQVIHFSRNLNCIIGGRGAGKSTAFEAIRCLSHTPSESKLINSEVWPENIHLVWVDRGGQQHTIRCRINDDAENLSFPEVGAVFPIESYGQNETAQTSVKAQDDPGALLQYMDRFVDIGDLQHKDEEIRSALLENQTNIEKAQNEVRRIPEYKKFLARVHQQLKALDTAHAKKVVAFERKIAEERSVREGIEQQLVKLATQLKDTSVTATLAAIESSSKVADLKEGQTEFEEIVSLTRAFQEIAKISEEKLASDATAFSVKVREHLTSWKESEEQYLTWIDERRQELKAQGIRLDVPYIKKLATDESSYRKSLKLLSSRKAYLTDLRKKRQYLLSERKRIRSRISSARTAYSARANKALQDALEDLTVSVKFMESGLSGEAEDIIQQAMSWRTSQVPRCALLVEQVTVPGLLDAIRKTDTEAVKKVTSADGLKPFSKSDAHALLQVLDQQETLFRLQRCQVEDRPKITLSKKIEEPGKPPRFISRDFAKLSLGQQQSVLLALMLSSDSDAPLIIDQPEDNLDSEFIFHSLVPVIRAAKERRQVIVVTHNANIAVLGDAEQIVALKSTSDKSVVVSAGSIDDSETKAVVCQILEGAEEAFRRRAKMYNVI